MNIQCSLRTQEVCKIPRVLLVEDHALVRESLAMFLKEGMSLMLGETDTGMDALKLIKHNQWDIVLLDIHLPDVNGVDILRQIKAINPNLPVLMLTMSNDSSMAMKVYKIGASGYFCKEQSGNTLLRAIQHVLNGEQYFNAATLKYFISHSENTKALSERESEILRLLTLGKSQTQIASQLDISVKTVSTYRSRVLQKLNLNNTAELLLYALRDKI